MKSVFLVAIGGASGSALRFLVGEWLPWKSVATFPWATVTVNLAGCLLTGLAVGAMSRYNILEDSFRQFFVIGFCGGFTTFSAFSREIFRMLSQNLWLHAILYTAISILAGVALTASGYYLIK
ncbi:MAG: fluoride efflux transporter CrcB [Dysgonamonadaceae bacterium]|jgi:CrcB protein|nr:fluoride efflux transporter CrcB [Dysgonamonadaceae bacterium]